MSSSEGAATSSTTETSTPGLRLSAEDVELALYLELLEELELLEALPVVEALPVLEGKP